MKKYYAYALKNKKSGRYFVGYGFTSALQLSGAHLFCSREMADLFIKVYDLSNYEVVNVIFMETV